MKKVRNEKAYKQTLVVREGGTDKKPKFLRINLAPGLNRISDGDWAAVTGNERTLKYAEDLRIEGILDFDDDAPKKKSSKKKSSKKPSDIDGL